MNKRIINILFVLIALGAIGYGIYLSKKGKPLRFLPIYGPTQTDASGDSVFHTVKAFSFTDQNGKTVTEKDFEDKIYVTDYFFVTCQSICPIMSEKMQKVAETFSNEPSVKFLSHTVNPEEDSVSVLLDYAKKHAADPGKWHFVTGDKKALYDMARHGYFLEAEEGDGGPDDFIHTQNFALIDKEKRIRGYYDGTSDQDIERLIKDIKLLLKEYEYRKNS